MAKENYVPKHMAAEDKKVKATKTEQKSKKVAPNITEVEQESVPKKMKSGKKQRVLIVVLVIVLMLVLFVALAIRDAFALKRIAMDTKKSAKTLATSLVAGNEDKYNRSIEELDKNVDALNKKLSSPLWKIVAKFPFVGGDVKSAKILSIVLDDVIDEALRPAVKVFNENPISGLKVGEDGYNAKSIIAYISLGENIIPELGSHANQLSSVSFKFIKLGSMEKYIDIIKDISAKFDKYSDYLSLIKTFLDDGSDKYYLITAQATNEMRATGGFPGSVGSLAIKDGVLSLGDFSSVSSYWSNWNAKTATPTSNDITLFGYWVNFPRNACCYLNFERTGYCWAEDCEDRTGQHVDGVISMTPAVVQKLLAVIDGEIKLSDGTIVNGNNATKALMYDLYFKYFNKERYDKTSDPESDAMFAETANKAMNLFMSSLDVNKIDDYINIFEESTKENIFKLWLRDEDGEKLIKNMGMAGTTNDDKDNPFAGIYLSINVPCKMGWFIDIEPIMSNPIKNSDGSMTYDMEVTFRNVISKEELQTAASYILGRTKGNIRCNLYFTAPMEGKVTDFLVESENKFTIKKGTYCGLDLGYCNSIFLYPGKDVVVKYKVTTAPGVSTPLEIVQTPTATKFR